MVIVTWDGWTDDLAGVEHYNYEVFELASDGIKLKAGTKAVSTGNNILLGTPTVFSTHHFFGSKTAFHFILACLCAH